MAKKTLARVSKRRRGPTRLCGLLARVHESLKAVIADVASNPRKLKPGELCRLLNSTPAGEVMTDRRLREQRRRAGHRIGDDKTVDLVRYAAWLADCCHAQRAARAAAVATATRAIPQGMGHGTPPDSAAGSTGARERNAVRMRESRKKARVVEVRPCADPERRARLEADIFAWLAWYFGEPFGPYSHEFTEQVRTIILSILKAIEEGGDQAIAASRGEGKTTAGEMVAVYAIVTGRLKFAILFEATGPDAVQSLASIKERLETNDRLADDYPEVCDPIRALENTPQRARTQIACGLRCDTGEPYMAATNFKWCGKEIVFPKIPGSKAAGCVIATRGLDSAVRGVKIGGKALRPDLALINDPDTDDTVNNPEVQGAKLEKKIDRGIAGLGGQTKRVARVMLTTVQRRGTVSDKFTDPAVKPSWKGRRFRFLVQPPAKPHLWDEYVRLLQLDWANEAAGNKTNAAAEHLERNFAEMHAGAVVANEHRRPGGERSALQFYYNEVARTSPEDVATELDNNPPEEKVAVESGITSLRVQRQVNGFPRFLVPPEAEKVTMGVDVRDAALHCVAKAWAPQGNYEVIDYRVVDVLAGEKAESDQALDAAIRRALTSLKTDLEREPFCREDGTPCPVDLTLIDSAYRPEVIYDWCLANNQLKFKPTHGCGKSSGCASPNFSPPIRNTLDKKTGDRWFLSRRPNGVWLVMIDADSWKGWVHDRWLSDPDLPGSLRLFGEKPTDAVLRRNPRALSDDQRRHIGYAKHVASEVEAEVPNKAGVMVRKWIIKPGYKQNHYLDASTLAAVAASILGVPLVGRRIVVSSAATAPQTGTKWFAQQEKR